MKNNIFNKIILLSLLVLGISACKNRQTNTEQEQEHEQEVVEDPFARPEPPTFVRMLTLREMHYFFNEVEEKGFNFSGYDLIRKEWGYSPVEQMVEEIITNEKMNKYEDFSFSTESHATMTIESNSKQKYPTFEASRNIDFLVSEDRVHTLIKKKDIYGVEDYDFRIEKIEDYDPEDLMFASIAEAVEFAAMDMGEFVLLDTENNYHMLGIEMEYKTYDIGGSYEHEYIDVYVDFVIDSNYKIKEIKSYYSLRYNYFLDDVRRPIESLVLVEDNAQIITFKNEPLKAMPNKAAKIASFPETTMAEEARVKQKAYGCYKDGDEIIVNTADFHYEQTNLVGVIRQRGGKAYSDVLISLYIENNEAFQIDFVGDLIKLDPFDYQFELVILYLNLSEGIPASLADELKVVEQGGKYYLTYVSDNVFSGGIRLNIAFDILFTTHLDEMGNPYLIYELNNIEIYEFDVPML